MTGAVLGLRPHVEHDHIAAGEPSLKLDGGQVLDLSAVAEVFVREHGDVGDVPDGDVAHGRPQVADPVAGQAVVDARSLAAGTHESRAREDLQVLGRVRDALRDLTGELVDRALALGEHVHNLRTATVPDRLRDGGKRVEEGCLGTTGRHMFKLSLEDLKCQAGSGSGRSVSEPAGAAARAEMLLLRHERGRWLLQRAGRLRP